MKLLCMLADTLRRSGGLGLMLGWMYCAFFSCGLIPHIVVLRSSERVWLWAGIGMAACALVIAILRICFKSTFVHSKIAGVIGAAISAVGSCCIWMAFVGDSWNEPLSATGGLLAGAGLAIMGIIWGRCLSGFEVARLERTVPEAFIIAFALYFILLAAKGALFLLACILMPIGSMVHAFHYTKLWACPFEQKCACGPGRPLEQTSRTQLRSMTPLFLLYFFMWVQFSSFRLISSPEVIGNRFMHYLIPFSCAAVVAILLFLLCIRNSRFLNYSLMYRWATPLMMLGCIIFLAGPNSWFDFRSVAYAANFVALFGVQLTLWIVTPKVICRMGFNPIVAFCGFLIAEGAGVATGLAIALPAVGHESTLSLMPLITTGATLLVAMSIGFMPSWFSIKEAINPLFAAKESARKANEHYGSLLPQRQPRTSTHPHETALNGSAAPAEFSTSELSPAALFDTQARMLQNEFCLTERETQICALLLAGRSRPYIRDELIISLNTVHTHAHNIFQKCEVKSQQELMSLPEKLMKN